MKPLFPKIKIILKIAETTGKIKGKPKIFIKMTLNLKLFLNIAFEMGIAKRHAKRDEIKACLRVKYNTLNSYEFNK